MVFLSKIKLERGWSNNLKDEFKKPYMVELRKFLRNEEEKNKTIYPSRNDIFAAFNYTPFDNVKVILIGQDPYHGPGQAHGLCFSVLPGIPLPPSLKNIFKEIKNDIGISIPQAHGYLQSWAHQGVLLLNAVLTVEKGKPASHQNKGWELFTDKIVEILAQNKNNLVFVLWGAYAQKKMEKVNFINKSHLILKAPHPSPFSAEKGFFGSKHFSKINKFLKNNGEKEIEWSLPLLTEIE